MSVLSVDRGELLKRFFTPACLPIEAARVANAANAANALIRFVIASFAK